MPKVKHITRIAYKQPPEKGEPGAKGAIRRVTEWAGNTQYYAGKAGEEYQDIVYYQGFYYLCTNTHKSNSMADPAKQVAGGSSNWALQNDYKFIASKVVLIGEATNGWIIDNGRIYHSSGKIELAADGSIMTSNGNFKVDADGNVTAKAGAFEGAVVAKQGKIGGFSLNDSWLEAEGNNYGALISAATFKLFANDFDLGDGRIKSNYEVHPYAVAYSFFYIMQRLVSAITPESGAADYSSSNRANILMYLSAKGQKKAIYGGGGIPYGGNFAAWCEGGMFAGLRPHTRSISSSISLSNTDHTIIVNNTMEITLTLPADPEIGQTFEIWHTSSTTLNVQTYNRTTRRYIYRMTKSTGYDYSVASTSIEIMKFVFAHNLHHNASAEDGMWLMIYYGKNA